MMHYQKGKNIEEELTKESIPIECLPKDFLWMHVKGGTTVSNVIDYAKKALDSGEHRSVVWTGSGGGVTKTISCAEILKRNYELHQVTRICYRKVEEYWDPLTKGLEQIVASREIPCIHILLSLDEIDPSTPGYQHSKTKTEFLKGSTEDKSQPGTSRKNNKKKPWNNDQNKRRRPKKGGKQQNDRPEKKATQGGGSKES